MTYDLHVSTNQPLANSMVRLLTIDGLPRGQFICAHVDGSRVIDIKLVSQNKRAQLVRRTLNHVRNRQLCEAVESLVRKHCVN